MAKLMGDSPSKRAR